MTIQANDYIEGVEHYGRTTKKVKGWVNKITPDGEHILYDIQADDNWKGYRGTIIFSELGEVVKLESKERIFESLNHSVGGVDNIRGCLP